MSTQEFDFAQFTSLERRDGLPTGILGLVVVTVLSTILLLQRAPAKFIEAFESGSASIELLMAIVIAAVIVMILIGIWAAYTSFSLPADSLTITSEDFTLHYPSEKVYRFSWNNRVAQLEIFYGTQTPSSIEWLKTRYGGVMSGGLVKPTLFSPNTLLTREAQAALEREARRHGFSVIDSTNLWGNRSVYLYGPDVDRKRRGTYRGEEPASFDVEGRIQTGSGPSGNSR